MAKHPTDPGRNHLRTAPPHRRVPEPGVRVSAAWSGWVHPADVSLYLRRMGLPEGAPPSVEQLCQLHAAHLMAVPFENLSIHLDEPVLLGPEDLVDKIPRRRRGGFCFELNGAFTMLLSALGYRVTRLAARVWTGDLFGPCSTPSPSPSTALTGGSSTSASALTASVRCVLSPTSTGSTRAGSSGSRGPIAVTSTSPRTAGSSTGSRSAPGSWRLRDDVLVAPAARGRLVRVLLGARRPPAAGSEIRGGGVGPLDGLWHGVPDDAEEIAGRNRRYMEGAAVDGVPLQVVELSGGPGDLYVMHVDCFHTSPRTAR